MKLRQEAIQAMAQGAGFISPHEWDSEALDALLDWLDDNADRIARRSRANAHDPIYDRYVADDVEPQEIRALVVALREDT